MNVGKIPPRGHFLYNNQVYKMISVDPIKNGRNSAKVKVMAIGLNGQEITESFPAKKRMVSTPELKT